MRSTGREPLTLTAVRALQVRLACLMFAYFGASSGAFAEDIDFRKIARHEREQLAGCMSDTMKVIEKHGLGNKLFAVAGFFESACGMEIEQVKTAANSELTDNIHKMLLPGQLVFSMMETASELLKKKPMTDCNANGCRLNEYRACVVQQMPTAIRMRKSPAEFEGHAKQQCEKAEGVARSALSIDFGNVQVRHLAGGLDHKMNNAIAAVVTDIRRSVVVMYAEDLIAVLPTRKSCKPQLCGASPCISLAENEPTEYECAIRQ